MRYWLLTAGIFICTLVHAQFGFYVEGGGNYSIIRATRSPGSEKGKGAFGAQAGVGVEYHFENDFFMYLSTDFSYQVFKKDSTAQGFPNVVSNVTYRPLLLNIPFGFAYQFNIQKSVGLKIYAGINTQIGVAGNVTHNTDYYIQDSTGKPIHVRSAYDKHSITYGRSINVQSEFQSDLANTIWGINVGAGLNFNKAVEVAIFYQEGLTNILPGGDGTPEVNKLRSITLNLKFYFPKNYYNSKQIIKH